MSKPKSDSALDKKIPYSADAERSLLGAVLLDAENAPTVFSLVRPGDFFLDGNRKIFSCMASMFGAGTPIDLITLNEELGRGGLLEAAGGSAYLSALVDGVPRVMNVEHYARIVKEKALLRNLIHASNNILTEAFEAEEPADEVLDRALRSMLELGGDQPAAARSFDVVAQASIEELDQMVSKPESIRRVYCGLSDIDDQVGGFWGGEIAVVAAPTSHGKTLFAEELAIHSARQGRRGIFFSAEMRGEELLNREVAWEAGVDYYYLRHPEWLAETQNREKMSALVKAAARLRELGDRIVIVDQGITPERIVAMTQAAALKGVDYIIVDFDQLVVDAALGAGNEDRWFAEQRRFMAMMKGLTRRQQVAVIILAQLRKLPPGIEQGKKPGLDDLYGDSAMRNLPQTIIFFFREFFLRKMNPKYERRVFGWVMKSRAGRTGRFELDFDPQRVRLLDAPPKEKESVPDEGEEE